MHPRFHVLIAAALAAALASCAKQGPVPDPFAQTLRGLEPANIADIRVAGPSHDSRPLSVAADQWPSLLALLHTLEPALDVRVESPSSPSAADWQAIGSVFVTLPSDPALSPPGRHYFFRLNVARHSRTRAVVAFVYSSRDQLMLPYRGSALSAWLRTQLRGA